MQKDPSNSMNTKTTGRQPRSRDTNLRMYSYNGENTTNRSDVDNNMSPATAECHTKA